MENILIALFIFGSSSAFALSSNLDESVTDYNLFNLTGKITTQEIGSCYSHAITNVLEAELKTRGALDHNAEISPSSLAFLYKAFPMDNVQYQSNRRVSDYALRLFNSEVPLNKYEKIEAREGSRGIVLLNLASKVGFCLEDETSKDDKDFDISRSNLINFYKRINQSHRKDNWKSDAAKINYKKFYPQITKSQFLSVLENAVKSNHFDYHRSFIELFCSKRRALVPEMLIREAYLSFEDKLEVFNEAIQLGKPLYIEYDAFLNAGNWSQDLNHASAVIGKETKCQKRKCDSFMILKDSYSQLGYYLGKIFKYVLPSIGKNSSLAHGWAQYRRESCLKNPNKDHQGCEDEYIENKNSLVIYEKGELTYIKKELLADAAAYIAFLKD